DLSRANDDGEVPLLSVHDPEEPIGYVRRAGRSAGLLKATLPFDSGTPEGHAAFERLCSGEVRGVSVGTKFYPNDVVVVDAHGREHPFDLQEWRQYWQPADSILHIKQWQLTEVSMTPRPLDRGAIARPISHEARRIRQRKET